MAKLVKFQILTGILIILRIEANIEIIQTGTEIHKKGSGKCCNECGENFTLTCRIETYSSYMTWQIDPDPIPISECIDDTCTLNPNVVGQYSLSTNTTLGIFNLIFLDFDLDFNTTVFKCGDGTAIESSDVLIRDYRPFLVENVTNELQVNSGCIHNFTNVLVEWIKMKYKDGKIEEETFTPSDPKEGKDLTSCSLDTTCGRNDLMKVTTLISIEQLDNSDGYYVQAVLTYDKVYTMKSAWSTGRYKIEDSCSFCPVCVLLIIQLIAIFVFIIGFSLFCGLRGQQVVNGSRQKVPGLLVQPDNERYTDSHWKANWQKEDNGCFLVHLVCWIVVFAMFIYNWISCKQMDHCLCCKIELTLRFVYLALSFLHIVFVGILVIVRDPEKGSLIKVIMTVKSSCLPVVGVLYTIFLIYKTKKTHNHVCANKTGPLRDKENDNNGYSGSIRRKINMAKATFTGHTKVGQPEGTKPKPGVEDGFASNRTKEVVKQQNDDSEFPQLPGNNTYDFNEQQIVNVFISNATRNQNKRDAKSSVVVSERSKGKSIRDAESSVVVGKRRKGKSSKSSVTQEEQKYESQHSVGHSTNPLSSRQEINMRYLTVAK